MTKKRQNTEKGGPTTPAKVAKKDPLEFNGTVFKTMLKEPTTVMKGLDTFIKAAQKLPCADLYDVVEGYIKISAECTEILKLLEEENKVESKMLLVLHSLEVILLRIASDLSHFSMVGTSIVKKIASTHMKTLQSFLHSENSKFVRQCLTFLAAMVSQSADSARDVFSQMHFGKPLSALAQRRDKMGRPDVRQAYIQFAISLLLSGDNSTIAQLLETKDFLQDILNSGIKEDRISIVNLILATLQSKVVQNKAISKTQKVRFFTPALLAHLASLYRWNGIVDSDVENHEAGKVAVREQVHSFLLDLCCSRKHGISFHDPSFGTSGRAGNIVLLQFLVSLKDCTKDDLITELVVSTLKSSPDVLTRYLKESQHSFIPRAKSTWQDNISLLKKIYEAQPEVSKAFGTREFIPLPRLLSMVMVSSLPSVCNKAFFTQGLNCKNTVVQHTTLSMASFILKRALKNIEHCQDKSVWQCSDTYTPAMMEEFVQLYREDLSKVLPDMTSIVYQWQLLTKKDKSEGDGEAGKTKEQTQESEETESHGVDETQVILLKAVILQVMCLYQKAVPHLVTQSRFDFSKLLKGIFSEKGMKEGVPPILQYQILQLALELPASKFSWFRVQDTSSFESAGGEKSVFYLLLKMFASSNTSHLKTSTRMLVLKVLKDSGVFEHTWRELELWLDHVASLEPANQEPVIQLLDKVLVKLLCNPHTYSDKAATLVQEAAYLQANLTGQDADAVSIPISHIDDVLDMVDVIMEGSEGEIEQLGPALTDDLIMQSFPFSAIVPAILEARNELPPSYKEEKGVVYEYLSAVLCDVLHCQRDPLALCLTLQQYDKELHSATETKGPPHTSVVQFHHYYSKWLPKQSQESLFASAEALSASSPVDLCAVLRAAYCEGPSALLQESLGPRVEGSLSSLELHRFPTVACQLLLYIRTTVDNLSMLPKGVGVSVVASLMEVLQAVVQKLQNSETEGMGEGPKAEEEGPKTEEGEELFLEVGAAGKDNKDEVLLAVLKSIYQHPCLEQWFLALELASLPAHSLNPVQLKRLCGQLSSSILCLLQATADAASRLGASLHLLSGYLSVVQRALLKELDDVVEKGGEGKRHTKESLALKALLALHKHMDVTGLKEVVSALLLLPKEYLVVAPTVTVTDDDCDVTMGDSSAGSSSSSQLSVYGAAALQVLTDSPSQDGALYLSRAHLCGLATLLTSCRSQSLQDFFLLALTSDPGSAKLVQTDVLLYCLPTGSEVGCDVSGGDGSPSSSSASMREVGSLLLQNCSTHRLCFELWCLENRERLAREAAGSTMLLGLLAAYLKMAAREDPARPSEVCVLVLSALKEALLQPLWSAMLAAEAGEMLSLFTNVLSSLVTLTTASSDVLPLLPGLRSILSKPHSFERWQLADAMAAKVEESSSPEQLESWRKSQLSAALRWLVACYSSCKEQEKASLDQEEAMLKRLETLLKASPQHVAASDWNSFVKSGLKYRYRHHSMLSTLSSLLELLYGECEPHKDLLPLATIHMMASSHSLFLPSMLDTEEEQSGSGGGGPQTKEALTSLSLALVKRSPSVCEMRHFVVLMGAYGATLSTADQKLLLLLQEYEKSDCSLVDFQSMLWGPAAVEHHKTRRSMGPSLWQQPSSEEVMGLLNPTRMQNTIAHFPQQRRLIPQEGRELIYKGEESDGHDAERDQSLCELYDPCFMLPLFSALLRPESEIDCLKFVSSHGLGLTIASLSSYDPKIRAAAYQVLGCFYQHLEGARFKGKRQLLYLLDMVRNGIKQQNLRVPFVMTTYVAKVAQQMLRPEEHMYMVINKFLLGHQYLDLKRVPEFFKLFYSYDLEHKSEREWMLAVLEEGVADRYCYELCDQQGLYHTLLGFCSSPLCEESTQILILNVLRKTARVTKGAYNLTKAHGLLTWLLQLLDKRFVSPRLLSVVVELAHTLWFTNLGRKEGKAEDSSSTPEEKDKPQSSTKCLPLPLINDFLCVLLSVIKHLRTVGMKAPQLKPFLRTLSSVLTHQDSAMAAHAEAGWLTLKPPLLSDTDVLPLLHRWAALAQDTALISTMLGLASTCQPLKDLLGVGRDRVRGSKGSSQQQSSRSRGGGEEQAEAEGGESEERDQGLLEDCKALLRNIFTHWEPRPLTPAATTSATPPLSSVTTSSNTAQPSPATTSMEPQSSPDTSAMVPQTCPEVPQSAGAETVDCPSHTTAGLLIKWSLRTLTSSSTVAPYDCSDVLNFTKWLHKVVLQHRGIISVLMADVSVKVDFLRLYHSTACECGGLVEGATAGGGGGGGGGGRVEALGLLTEIMLHLLEAQGVPQGALHQTVITTCLTETTEDHTRREAGLLLFSMYIHELWSGVQSADLFLNHVRLVTSEQGQLGTSNSPLVIMCREILTASLEPSMPT
ncbi:nucleolar pre-ribosomal-associated protein 1 [Engraulis encrasicolus]|uniref:nucleolar pre-ribosomal-associated protein 1 n=1 Tax=Engraulis encrasicolus TaxID=184585 RepID=UPI002FD6C971